MFESQQMINLDSKRCYLRSEESIVTILLRFQYGQVSSDASSIHDITTKQKSKQDRRSDPSDAEADIVVQN